MNILVTGGAGFVGSHVVEILATEGHKITVVDNFSSGNVENLAEVKQNQNVEIVDCDIRELDAQIFNAIEAVIHLAAIVGVQESIDNPIETHDVNVNGTLNVLEACRKARVKKFIFASSAAVYGDAKKLPITEDTPLQPLSPYALHKVIGEQYAKLYSDQHDIKAVALRFFNIYGPRQKAGGYAGLITALKQAINEQSQVSIYGDGLQTRDFIHVRDVAAAIVASLEVENSMSIYNVGDGQAKSVKEILDLMQTTTGKAINVARKPARKEVRNSVADISKIKQELNWRPTISFKDGLQELVG